MLDYQSQQVKLMPLLATAYALHFAKDVLVTKYVDMKRTKDARLVEEVHALRCGEGECRPLVRVCCEKGGG